MSAMWHLVWPAVAFVVTLLAALTVCGLLGRALRRRIRAHDGLAAFLRAIRLPSILWATVLALCVAIEVADLPRRLTDDLGMIFQVALILSVTFTALHPLDAKPIRAGDYVKVADAVEGYVVDIGWRSTRVRMLQNTVVVVPNKKVAESVITNFDLPEPSMALSIRVSVSYRSDPDRVERVLVDEATKATGQIRGLLAEPAPFARLIPGFGESSLDFTLNCQVASFVDQYLVQHELRKRILRRLRAEGIEIPYPTRAAELRDERS